MHGGFTKSPPIRPISARLRRPSMNSLDVIQEVPIYVYLIHKTVYLVLFDGALIDSMSVMAGETTPREEH